jgi:hypothetical protein
MTPSGLVAEAATLMSTRSARLTCWPRTCAVLLRCALEAALAEYWSGVDARLAKLPMAHQLLVLHGWAGREMAADVGEAWRCLSHAAHHHAYELSPTMTELVAWRTHVERLISELGTATVFPGRRQSLRPRPS